MQHDPIESNLLKRVLMDPATGLPNTLFLELIRNWGEAIVERHGGTTRQLVLTIEGGTQELRRTLVTQLLATLRRSDMIASEGPRRLYLLLAMRDHEDTEPVERRIDLLRDELNASHPDVPPISVEIRPLDGDTTA